MLNFPPESWRLNFKFDLRRGWYAFGNSTNDLVIQSQSFEDSACVKSQFNFYF